MPEGPDLVMSTAVIYNPGALKPATVEEIARLVRVCSPGAQFVETANASEFRRFATSVALRGFRRAVVAGGDRFLHLAINELAGTGLEIAVVPVGDGNDFARTIGMPADLPAALEVAFGPATIAVDVGHIQCRDHGFRAVKRRFVNVATTRPREIPKHITPSRFRIGQVFSGSAGRIFRAGRREIPRVRLWIDGRDVGEMPTSGLIVGNGQFSDGGMRRLPQARLNDGLFDVVRLRCGARGEDPVLSRSGHGIPLDHPLVDHWRARRVEATAVGDVPVSIEADGELLGWLPAAFEIEPASLTLVVPAATLPARARPPA